MAIWQAALALFALTGAGAPAASHRVPPLPAPPLYVTHNHGLAITIPRGLTYCPLPDDWVGSDHGVELYLVPPLSCGRAGLPSSDRDAAPERPAFEIFYEINTSDYVDSRYCHATVAVRVFEREVQACRRRDGEWITVEAGAGYTVDHERHDLVLTLRTTKSRYAADLFRFRAFAIGVRTCRPEWAGGRQPACPKTQWF